MSSSRGFLHSIHRGVYAIGHPLLGVEGRRIAAVLASGGEAVLSHRSAARLWGLLRGADAIVEITRPRAFRPRDGIVTHRSSVSDDERTVVRRVPVTTVPRTILDLAAVVSKRELERVVNEAEVSRLTRLSVPDLLERYPRKRGAAVLRSILRDFSVLDGRAVHGTVRAFESDRERDRLLQVEGWAVTRVTWRQLRDDGSTVAADLHRLLRQRELR